MAQAVINSSPYDPDGRYQLFANSYFWYGNRLQVYPVVADAEIPAPSMWSVLTEYGVEGTPRSAGADGQRLDGFFLDDATSTFGGVENHRRDLWAYSDFPLTFSYATRRVMLFDALLDGRLLPGPSATISRARDSCSWGAWIRRMYAWFAPYFDVLGGETPGADVASIGLRPPRPRQRPRPGATCSFRANGVAPGAADVLAYLRQALLLGYFPGFNGTYWRTSAAYERDRPLFRQYIPLIRTVVGGRLATHPRRDGLRPEPARRTVRPGERRRLLRHGAEHGRLDEDLPDHARRCDDRHPERHGPILELVRNKNLSASRVGPDVRFSDTLAAGETFVYQVTAPRPAPPSRGPVHSVAPRS